MARILHRMQGSLEDMSDRDLKKWAQHVRDGHVPFNGRCKTCVETSATGKAHRRVLAPSCYTLSVDVVGSIRAKGETADSKKYKYVLAGSYTMPKLEVYKTSPSLRTGTMRILVLQRLEKIFRRTFLAQTMMENLPRSPLKRRPSTRRTTSASKGSVRKLATPWNTRFCTLRSQWRRGARRRFVEPFNAFTYNCERKVFPWFVSTRIVLESFGLQC